MPSLGEEKRGEDVVLVEFISVQHTFCVLSFNFVGKLDEDATLNTTTRGEGYKIWGTTGPLTLLPPSSESGKCALWSGSTLVNTLVSTVRSFATLSGPTTGSPKMTKQDSSYSSIDGCCRSTSITSSGSQIIEHF